MEKKAEKALNDFVDLPEEEEKDENSKKVVIDER